MHSSRPRRREYSMIGSPSKSDRLAYYRSIGYVKQPVTLLPLVHDNFWPRSAGSCLRLTRMCRRDAGYKLRDVAPLPFTYQNQHVNINVQTLRRRPHRRPRLGPWQGQGKGPPQHASARWRCRWPGRGSRMVCSLLVPLTIVTL
jgi:hypothetical protein